jgi:alpha-glucosidase
MTWWHDAVFYQIYPRSFLDTNGDGVGDLGGILQKMPYLAWLGVDALWITPIYPSPMRDFSYDISDYCDVDPLFGTLEDFDQIIAKAHEANIRVILDWVPNHTSSDHPWFQEAKSSRTNPKRDWYVWKEPTPDGKLPNNWLRSWSDQPAWTLDDETGQFYLHCFLPEQPDLNWANVEVRDAMAETLRFWLRRGIDGFRMDVVHLIGKDPSMPDDPEDLVAIGHVPLNDRPEAHVYLKGIRKVLEEFDGERTSVGEVYLLDPEAVATYYGQGDELHMSFNFASLFTPWRAASWVETIARTESSHNAVGAWPTWTLSNHDNKRIASRLDGDPMRTRSAAILVLTLRGTPFLYAGEELGLEDAIIPPERVVDPGLRDPCRAPLPWTNEPLHGWPTDPWLPFAERPNDFSVQTQEDNPASMLSFVRNLLSIRRASVALRQGGLSDLRADNDVLHYRRQTEEEVVDVFINFAKERRPITLPPESNILLSSSGADVSASGELLLVPGDGVIVRVLA